MEIAANFDLRVERPAPPQGLHIVTKIFEYQPFTTVTPEEVLAQIVSLTNAGKTNREFCKWMKGYPRQWAELLFCTVSLATYSYAAKEQMLEVREALPYWMLCSMTTSCKPHSRLDGLVRRWDNPVWEDVYPPNGWACGCCVVACIAEDCLNAPEIKLSAQFRAKCRNWLQSDPSLIVAYLDSH